VTKWSKGQAFLHLFADFPAKRLFFPKFFVILQQFSFGSGGYGSEATGWDDIMDIGVFWRLGFDSVRTSQTLTVRQKQGNEDAP